MTRTAENHKRKNLSIVEIIDQNGFVARAEKKYSYYVSEQNNTAFNNVKEIQEWMGNKSDAVNKKSRHVSIKKIFDQKTGMGQMIYRVIGSFYVVQNLHIFVVVFMHTIKFDMLSGNLPQSEGNFA